MLSNRSSLAILAFLGFLGNLVNILNFSSFKRNHSNTSVIGKDDHEEQCFGGLKLENDSSLVTLDPICGACRYRKIPGNETCGHWVQQVEQHTNQSTISAGRRIANEHPTVCQVCDPEYKCSCADKLYWRLDTAAPRVKISRHGFFDSVPAQHQFPRDKITPDKAQEYLANKPNGSFSLYHWNPNVIALPREQVPTALNETAAYLAIFRTTTRSNCFKEFGNRKTGVKSGGGPKNSWLGFLFLRQNLSPITDVIFAPNFYTADVRLFLTNGQLYFYSFHHIWPFWFNDPHKQEQEETGTNIITLNPAFGESSIQFHYRGYPSCCDGCRGKNFGYFVDAHGKTMVQPYVLPMRHQEIDLEKACNESITTSPTEMVISDPFIPEPSFYTVDQLYFSKKGWFGSFWSPYRGSACCIRIPSDQVESGYLLVGISHRKTVPQPYEVTKAMEKHGVKRFAGFSNVLYAFDPAPPYRLVARTGDFCMPNAVNEEQAMQQNYFAGHASLRKVFHGGIKYNCSTVNFVSGIAEHPKDPDSVVIAFGEADCVGRLVQVSKNDLVQMLFDPASRLEEK